MREIINYHRNDNDVKILKYKAGYRGPRLVYCIVSDSMSNTKST